MAIDVYDQLTTFTKMLGNLDAILGKAEDDAKTRNIDPQVFIQGRLAPDMLPFV